MNKIIASMVLFLILLEPVALWLFGEAYKLQARGSLLFWPVAAIVAVLDPIFNAVHGSYYFREWPHELMFSNRVRRHLKSPFASPDRNEALLWKYKLNKRWPGHITE